MFHFHFYRRETSFLHDACAYGLAILNRAERHNALTRRAYRLWQNLFRFRMQSNVWIDRHVSHPIDLFSIPKGQPAKLLINDVVPPEDPQDNDPQYGVSARRRTGLLPHQRANIMFKQLATEHPINVKAPEIITPFYVTRIVCEAQWYMRTKANKQPANTQQVTKSFVEEFMQLHARYEHSQDPRTWLNLEWEIPSKIASRGCKDYDYVDRPCLSPDDWNPTTGVAAVRRSLLRACNDDDIQNVLDKPDCLFKMFRALRRAAGERKRPSKFGDWLKNWRQHYVPKGDSIRRAEIDPKLLARQCYSLLVWTSCRAMARCYGVLMLLVERAIAQSQEAGDFSRFRRVNFPQWYLGGLPIWFLGGPQQRFIAPALYAHWLESTSLPGEDSLDAGLRINNDLMLYADLMERRAEADNESSPRIQSIIEGVDDKGPTKEAEVCDAIPSAEVLLQQGYLPRTIRCTECDNQILAVYVLQDAGSRYVVGKCDKCGQIYNKPRNPAD